MENRQRGKMGLDEMRWKASSYQQFSQRATYHFIIRPPVYYEIT